MKKILLLITAVVLVTSGCKYSSEPDEKAFVTAIGIDKGEKFNLRFTFVFASPSKDDSESGGGEGDETIVVEAPSLYSAIEDINSFKSKKIELTHAQTVVFSEELASEGLKDYIYMLVRSNDFRPNIYLCIADKSSMDFLENVKPTQTHHLEKYFQYIFEKWSHSSYGEMYLYDVYFDLLSENKASILPYCAINDSELNEEEPSESESEEDGQYLPYTDDFAVNIVAGDNVRKHENPAEIQGGAVLKDGVFQVLLGKEETMTAQMIADGFPDSYLTVSNPTSAESMITVYLSQGKKAKISVKAEENPKISIFIDIEGDFISVGYDDSFVKNPKAFEEYLEEKMENEIMNLMKKSTDELDSDICGFSEKAKKCFSTVKDWKAYDWEEKYKNAEFDVNVNVTMRTYGELTQDV